MGFVRKLRCEKKQQKVLGMKELNRKVLMISEIVSSFKNYFDRRNLRMTPKISRTYKFLS